MYETWTKQGRNSPKRFELSQSVLKQIGFDSTDYELAIRFTEDFYKENKEFIASIIKKHGRPALVEMWKERFFYFVLKWEFNFIDNLDKASALSTDQIDIENAQRYGITFVDESGKKQTPLILHNSPSGAIERDIYGLARKSCKGAGQRKGALTSNLALSHPRKINSRLAKVCGKLRVNPQDLEEAGVRVDIDDREESVGKRIRDAEREWLPFVIVFGDKEALNSSRISVRVRSKGETVEMSSSGSHARNSEGIDR